MTFTEFLNNNVIYAYFLIGLMFVGASIYIIRTYLGAKKKKSEVVDWDALKTAVQEDEKPKKKEVKHKVDKKVVVKVEQETIVPYVPLKRDSKFSVKFWKEWILDKYFPDKIVLIHMELLTGFHRLFVVKEKEDGFEFKKKKYLFDDESKYYNIDAKLYTFDYHEGIALPIRRKIPMTLIKKTIESTEGIDIEYAVNPSTLQRFMTAKIAEGVMKGTQLDEFMKKLQMFLLVTMIAVLVHLALFLYASGILQNLKVPGI